MKNLKKSFMLTVLCVPVFVFADQKALYQELSTKLTADLNAYVQVSTNKHDLEKLRKLGLSWLDSINTIRKSLSEENTHYLVCMDLLQQNTVKANSLLEDIFELEETEGEGKLRIALEQELKNFTEQDMHTCLLESDSASPIE